MANNSANNNLNAIGTFLFREQYQEESFKDLSASPLDIWNKKLFYGKINYNSIPIFPKENKMQKIAKTKNVFAFDFVASAFEELRQKIANYSIKKKIDISNSFLSNFVAQKGWISPHKIYNDHISSIYKIFFEEYGLRQNNLLKINSFNSFKKEFHKFFHNIEGKFPFCFSSFILSKYCPILSNGLSIEIAFDKHDDDEMKKKKFLEDKNFVIFSKLCQEHSFFLDKNAPWRLIFNINSPKAIKYFSRFNIDSSNFLFDEYYFGASNLDPEYYSFYLKTFYNSIVNYEKAFDIPVLLLNGTIRPAISERSSISNIKKDNAFFLDLLRILHKDLKINNDFAEKRVNAFIKLLNVRTNEQSFMLVSKNIFFDLMRQNGVSSSKL